MGLEEDVGLEGGCGARGRMWGLEGGCGARVRMWG